MKFPKHEYVRSKKLLQEVALLDCQLCGSSQYVQAAHSNWGSGKGMGVKADDSMVAALCTFCHRDIDQGSKWSKRERQQAWWVAHRKTVETLVDSGRWPENVPIPDGTEWEGLIPDH